MFGLKLMDRRVGVGVRVCVCVCVCVCACVLASTAALAPLSDGALGEQGGGDQTRRISACACVRVCGVCVCARALCVCVVSRRE